MRRLLRSVGFFLAVWLCLALPLAAVARVPAFQRLIFGATPNMGLTLPSPGVTPGPTWATQLVTALTTIDAHDHTSGKGVPVPFSGLSATGNFDVGGFDVQNCAQLDFSAGPSLYANGTDLFFYNGDSTVQLTAADNLNCSLVRGVNGAGYSAPVAINWDNTNKEYTFDQASGSRAGGAFSRLRVTGFLQKAANYTVTAADQAGFVLATANSFTLTLPVATTTPNKGRLLTVKCVAASGTMTVARQGSDTIDTSSTSVSVTCAANGGSAITFWSDGVSKWYQIAKF